MKTKVAISKQKAWLKKKDGITHLKAEATSIFVKNILRNMIMICSVNGNDLENMGKMIKIRIYPESRRLCKTTK